MTEFFKWKIPFYIPPFKKYNWIFWIVTKLENQIMFLSKMVQNKTFSFSKQIKSDFSRVPERWQRICLQCRKPRFNPWVRRRKWQPTPVLLLGKSHGQRSLVGYSPWGHKVLDMTEWLTTTLHTTWRKRQESAVACTLSQSVWLGVTWPLHCSAPTHAVQNNPLLLRLLNQPGWGEPEEELRLRHIWAIQHHEGNSRRSARE